MNNYEAGKAVAQASPGAAGVLVATMDANARHMEWIEAQVRQGIERERDEWRERALHAEARLARIESRIDRFIA